MSYVLGIVGYVGIVCSYNINTEQLICNSPAGYDVVAVDSNNNKRLLESSNGPVKKQVKYTVNNNENIVITPHLGV